MNCPSCGHENLEGSDRCENCLAPFRDLDVPRADSAEGLARSVMEDNLGQLEQEQPITVSPDTPALEVAALMRKSNTGCALVVDNKKLIGIFTEHDVLLHLTKPPGQGQEQEAAAVGTNLRVDELPVNEMPFSEVPFEEMRAEEMMLEETTTTGKKGNDGIAADVSARPQLQVLVKDLMSRDPETLREADSVAEAVNKMSLGRYRHIPFVKSDGTYGVASIKAVLKYIAQEDW